MIDVVVADWQPLSLDGLARVIRQDRELQLVREVDDIDKALAAIRRVRPAVALIAPREDDLAPRLLRRLQREALPTRVIVLGADPGGWTWDALGLGAAGVLSRAATPDDVRAAVRSAARGETTLCSAAQSAIASDVRARHAVERHLLSEREHQVLGLLADGLSTPEIGRRLQIATTTVRTHVKHLHDKLGARDRAQLVREAMRRGLIE